MNDRKTTRTKWLTVRFSEAEEKRLQKLKACTTAASLSEYARAVLLQTPVTVRYRNQSADDFLAEMIQFKKQLTAIGNSLNQNAHRLYARQHIVELKAWAQADNECKKTMLKKVEEINDRLSQIHALWSQK